MANFLILLLHRLMSGAGGLGQLRSVVSVSMSSCSITDAGTSLGQLPSVMSMFRASCASVFGLGTGRLRSAASLGVIPYAANFSMGIFGNEISSLIGANSTSVSSLKNVVVLVGPNPVWDFSVVSPCNSSLVRVGW